MDAVLFTVDNFDVDWLSGAAAGHGPQLQRRADATARAPASRSSYDLRVNHPLSIGDTELFLIGHGYAPVITVRDGNGDIAYSGPTVFLPQDPTCLSFGVIKAPVPSPPSRARGAFYPTFVLHETATRPLGAATTRTRRCRCSSTPATSAWTPGRRSRSTSSTSRSDGGPGEPTASRSGSTCTPGQTVELPDGLGSMSFEGMSPGPGSRSARRPASRSPWPAWCSP